VTSDTSQLEGKKGIGVSVAPPEVTSFLQRSHPKQASETHILHNFRNTGPKLFKVSEFRTQEGQQVPCAGSRVAKRFHQCSATPRKKPWAQWYDFRPRVPHYHNHKGRLGNADFFFIETAFAFALLYAPKDKSCRIIEHGAGLRSTARSNCAGNEGRRATQIDDHGPL
jgi:hypothetical protein